MNSEIVYGDAVALNWDFGPSDGEVCPPKLQRRRVQLSPFGEFELRDGGKRSGTVQHCTREAFEAMVANWKAAGSPEVLVDVDHASATGVSTEAAAWARNLRVEDEGLCADFELTPRGRELVEGRRYRFVSPGWTLSEDGTPLALCSVALTNRPNLPVKPVVNADGTGGRDPDDPNNERSGGAPSPSGQNHTKGNPEMDPKKIAAALGLPETATEEEVLAAIKAKDDTIAQAAAEAANAKADEFADNAVKAGKVAANSKEAVKVAYLKSPEVAEAMLNSVAAPSPSVPLPDFGKAKTPEALNAAKPGADADPVAVYNHYVSMPEGAEKEAYLNANQAKIEAGYAKSLKG
jgi:phage I-like protein